ncbi:sugar phosphate isomerase/epimerase family protein [Aquisphaera insulae]|uniref:sugar phosphate isomerase/epimerase family protein n=1 Tax=Aquisphaera insulae TaxID=2712864 RepID=UPI0013EC5AA6|nr:sugar phosphate isomerase/epimerase [Aquisphaera insulae]
MSRILSCFTNCYGPDGVRTAVERIHEAGIDHLELALRGHNFGGLIIPESAVITEKADEATVRSFLDLLDRHRVRISGCNVGGADIRTAEGLALTESRIRFAARWFAVPVCVSGAGQPANPAERTLIVDHLRRLGDTAGAVGVILALETHKGPTQNAAAMLALMDEVDHPSVRLNFDTGNIAYYNAGVDPCDELEKVKHLVRNVHLKDNRGRFEDWYFPAVGEGGAVDFGRVREILDGVGFAGPFTIEIEGIGGEPEPGLEGRQDRIARSVRHLRACGYLDAAG